MVEVFPVVLCHQTKQGQKGPPKGVKAGVAIVGVSSCLQTDKPVRTLSAAQTQKHNVTLKSCFTYYQQKFLHINIFCGCSGFSFEDFGVANHDVIGGGRLCNCNYCFSEMCDFGKSNTTGLCRK